ncbi:phenylacetate--CoA ligase family protein [Microbacterium sp. MC2]
MSPGSYRAWRELLAHDGLTAEAVADLRDRRSIEIARFAFEKSPFYRDYYSSHGFGATELRDPSVFSSLPFLTKDLIREHYDRIKTPEANDRTAVKSVSSGSTGHPLTVLSDRRAPVRAYEWRAMSWWGVDPWENAATIDRSWRKGVRKLQHHLFWWPIKRTLFHTLQLDETTLDRFLKDWERYKPQYIVGFIGGVSTVAQYAAAKGVRLHPTSAVGVTAGPLFEGHRREMEDVYGGPVYNIYRSTESNWLATECREQNGLHVFEDIKHLEVVNDDGSPTVGADAGETVFTDFENRVFPLVRYRIGDRTSRIDGACVCGRPFRRVTRIDGRIVDSLVFPSGRTLTGDIFDYFEGSSDYLRQYQVYQAADYSVEVTIRLTEHQDARKVAEERVARLREHVGGEAPVELKIVDEIEPVRGKFRPIVSDAPRAPA